MPCVIVHLSPFQHESARSSDALKSARYSDAMATPLFQPTKRFCSKLSLYDAGEQSLSVSNDPGEEKPDAKQQVYLVTASLVNMRHEIWW